MTDRGEKGSLQPVSYTHLDVYKRQTVSSRVNEFEPIVCNVNIDELNGGIAHLDIVQLGHIKVSYDISENASDVLMVYNANGQLMRRYIYSDKVVTTEGLEMWIRDSDKCYDGIVAL